MEKIKTIFLILTLSCLTAQILTAQKAGVKFDNKISGWGSAGISNPVNWQIGARYIPTLSPWLKINETSRIDAELSLNTYGNLLFSGAYFDTSGYDLKPYRLWLRYTTTNLEIRAGLQKINFGSALIFRPLMWFDKMDFRDPLQLTDGVYGLLGRYYFNNNVNIWLWTLYGNTKEKGWEIAPSPGKKPEFGGRLQIPVPKGEIAMSYHNRKADYSRLLSGIPAITDTIFTEQMFAFDGKWDLGIGLWFEYVKKLNDEKNKLMSRWETYYCLGIDYTFNVGNGLTLTSEFFHYSNTAREGQVKTKSNYSTLSLNYPLFLSHSITGLVYYNWDAREWYRFLNLQLKYDYLSLYLMAFWNPDEFTLYKGGSDNNLFAGKGFQIMLVLDI
jgi:hypothetical protein